VQKITDKLMVITHRYRQRNVSLARIDLFFFFFLSLEVIKYRLLNYIICDNSFGFCQIYFKTQEYKIIHT